MTSPPPPEPFRTYDVARIGAFGDETMGTKDKFWRRDESDGTTWLFKFARDGTGEHWAEKVAAHVGLALGVPVARVELATCEGRPGSMSLSFTGTSPLVHGNELLQEVDATYPVAEIRGVRQHTVEGVLAALENAKARASPAASTAPRTGSSDTSSWTRSS